TDQGTGLGLSMAYDIVQQHNGEFVVTSEPGVGSTFSLILPVRKAGA
ncbi:MAG: ATP-binding protein, partial [Pseudomonadota bacterium]